MTRCRFIWISAAEPRQAAAKAAAAIASRRAGHRVPDRRDDLDTAQALLTQLQRDQTLRDDERGEVLLQLWRMYSTTKRRP